MIINRSTFVRRESFKHKFAKELIYKWLKEGGFEDVKSYENCNGNGVFVEYPLCPNTYPNSAAFNYNHGSSSYAYYRNLNFSPSYDDCIKNNDIPIKVADIATVRKGNINAIFEVYHTHRIEISKIRELHQKYPDLLIYEISADTILRLTEKPSTILNLCQRVKEQHCGIIRKVESKYTKYTITRRIVEIDDLKEVYDSEEDSEEDYSKLKIVYP